MPHDPIHAPTPSGPIIDELQTVTDDLVGKMLELLDGKPLLSAYAAATSVSMNLQRMLAEEQRRVGIVAVGAVVNIER